MTDLQKELQAWLSTLSHYSLPKWDALPDLDLYMDQIVTYLERELAPLSVEDQEKMITTWMINNYVKGNLLPNPVKKKYSKEHLGYLLGISAIKQILSIPNIAMLFQYSDDTKIKAKSLYRFFRNIQTDKINTISSELLTQIKDINLDSETDDSKLKSILYELVFKLAVEAEVKKIIANKILYFISQAEMKNPVTQSQIDKNELEKLDKEKKKGK
ncbi:MAG: DUF1836 domain-containing protein [Bacilli bacterium]|jgi:hypothetical protein|nr:DUF1836 domain-containing protein [Bacilli bacterium]